MGYEETYNWAESALVSCIMFMRQCTYSTHDTVSMHHVETLPHLPAPFPPGSISARGTKPLHCAHISGISALRPMLLVERKEIQITPPPPHQNHLRIPPSLCTGAYLVHRLVGRGLYSVAFADSLPVLYGSEWGD